ncbi:GNAT family N-acetyltransferase [Oceanobacillus damuensis]|uniref:GNAT family N-acetyltransferase n=1 Tax=Oceanobacillus damuensis TaxID=937928 RepID=UPI00082CA720|nr:GNAT family N-acetyltransferase [Oceanobacillus damuensis]
MQRTKYLEPTPWDQRNFNINTYQLTEYSEEALMETDETGGHFTIKVDPLADTAALVEHGFYYVDTLIEPICKKEQLLVLKNDQIHFTREYNKDELLDIAEEAFSGGRFHRDFNIPDQMADRRYRNWVNDLIEKDLILALDYDGRTAGFFAYENDKILLLAIKREFRGIGLAKAFTSSCVAEQFKLTGYDTLRTSISPSNLASLNVFISLGFRLISSVDVYHKLNGSLQAGG